MRFTPEQREQWLERGYLVGGPFLEDSELDAIGAAFLTTIDHLRREQRLENVKSDAAADDSKQVFQIRTAHLAHPLFDKLIHDPRLLDAIESLIGPNLRLVHFQGLYKPPYTGGNVAWHQDDYYFGLTRDAVASCWLALDDATVDNGCMWVVPRAHRHMYDHHKNWDPNDKKGFFFSINDPSFLDFSTQPIEIKRGQCLFHHGLMPHRSLRNTSGADATRLRNPLFRCDRQGFPRPLPEHAGREHADHPRPRLTDEGLPGRRARRPARGARPAPAPADRHGGSGQGQALWRLPYGPASVGWPLRSGKRQPPADGRSRHSPALHARS